MYKAHSQTDNVVEWGLGMRLMGMLTAWMKYPLLPYRHGVPALLQLLSQEGGSQGGREGGHHWSHPRRLNHTGMHTPVYAPEQLWKKACFFSTAAKKAVREGLGTRLPRASLGRKARSFSVFDGMHVRTKDA